MINEILKTEIKELYDEGNKLLEDFSCDIVIQYQKEIKGLKLPSSENNFFR